MQFNKQKQEEGKEITASDAEREKEKSCATIANDSKNIAVLPTFCQSQIQNKQETGTLNFTSLISFKKSEMVYGLINTLLTASNDKALFLLLFAMTDIVIEHNKKRCIL